MYCINCGIKLADTEKKCPLCGTVVYHPELKQSPAVPLYPQNRIPRPKKRSKALGGAIIILYLIPLLISLLSDLQSDNKLNWFGYVAGALLLSYIFFALPLWFNKPNPVIFIPCDFAAAILYLLYLNISTGGHWFLSFALPIAGASCLITSAVITLLRYLKRGRLYIFGGAFIASGASLLLLEFLMTITFPYRFFGWSIYPLMVLTLLGGTLIYLAINKNAREAMERKLFF